MLSKKDQAIKEALEKEHTLESFFNNVLIDNPILDTLDPNDMHYAVYEDELYRTCHVWQARIDAKGYGDFGLYSKIHKTRLSVKAHRFAYAIEYGFDDLPKSKTDVHSDNLVINHLCHNRACVNPRHLEVITHSENTSTQKIKPRKPNDAIIADNLEDFMEQIRNTEND